MSDLKMKKPSNTLSLSEWVRYRDILGKLSQTAADEFRDAVWHINGRWHGAGLGAIPRDELIDYAYALVTKYSEGASAVACEFYDEMAALQGANVPPAVPAETPTYPEVSKTVNGTIKVTPDEETVSGAIGQLVKRTGQDTTLQNALRDGAEVAWIPHGDTCAFCITLASRGWQRVSRRTLKNGHAEHIHSHCDCAYGVRFNSFFSVNGYKPGRYEQMYEDAGRDINAMRRDAYAANSEEINAQKRAAYARRKEREANSG